MSERPAPITRTDEILLHLVDRVDALSDVLAGRSGAPASGAPKAASAAKKATTQKAQPKGKKTATVDGR